jgi:hypothetical protein
MLRHSTQMSSQAIEDIQSLKALLTKSRPLRIITCSSSATTAQLLQTMLSGFLVTSMSSMQETEAHLRTSDPHQPPLDFLILDDQSETHAEELSRFLHSLNCITFQDTKIIHLYTPTTDSLSGHAQFSSNTPGVVKMTKPPRITRLLHTFAELKALIQTSPSQVFDPQKVTENSPALLRTLYGNVLIAEGWCQRLRTSRPLRYPSSPFR